MTRLLLTPFSHPAPVNSPGDVVRVSDGACTVYLTPDEYEGASETHLRRLLAAKASEIGKRG